MRNIFLFIVIFAISCGTTHYDRRSVFDEQKQEEILTEVQETSEEKTGLEDSSNKSFVPSSTSVESTISAEEEMPEEASDQEMFLFDRVMITEVVTDPQQDHGESSGGNGVLFDETPGTGTIGTTDEYVELYNGTSMALDVSFWTFNMLDGTDESQVLSDEAWDVFFSEEEGLENFAPGEFLILGNPNGAMNNTITLELVDENGGIVDEVFVDDANANGLSDEASFLDETGTWVQGAASPGEF